MVVDRSYLNDPEWNRKQEEHRQRQRQEQETKAKAEAADRQREWTATMAKAKYPRTMKLSAALTKAREWTKTPGSFVLIRHAGGHIIHLTRYWPHWDSFEIKDDSDVTAVFFK